MEFLEPIKNRVSAKSVLKEAVYNMAQLYQSQDQNQVQLPTKYLLLLLLSSGHTFAINFFFRISVFQVCSTYYLATTVTFSAFYGQTLAKKGKKKFSNIPSVGVCIGACWVLQITSYIIEPLWHYKLGILKGCFLD